MALTGEALRGESVTTSGELLASKYGELVCCRYGDEVPDTGNEMCG